MSASVVSSSDAICLVHENGVSNAHDYATAMWLSVRSDPQTS
jgi:hypothetical protein